MSSWQHGVALVKDLAHVMRLTAATELHVLEIPGELDLKDVLVSASDAILDRVIAEGAALTDVNPRLYERAVAFQFLALLAAQNYLTAGNSSAEALRRYLDLSDRYYNEVHQRRSKSAPGALRRGSAPCIANPRQGRNGPYPGVRYV